MRGPRNSRASGVRHGLGQKPNIERQVCQPRLLLCRVRGLDVEPLGGRVQRKHMGAGTGDQRPGHALVAIGENGEALEGDDASELLVRRAAGEEGKRLPTT